MKKIYITPQINFGDRPNDHYDELLMSITAKDGTVYLVSTYNCILIND